MACFYAVLHGCPAELPFHSPKVTKLIHLPLWFCFNAHPLAAWGSVRQFAHLEARFVRETAQRSVIFVAETKITLRENGGK